MVIYTKLGEIPSHNPNDTKRGTVGLYFRSDDEVEHKLFEENTLNSGEDRVLYSLNRSLIKLKKNLLDNSGTTLKMKDIIALLSHASKFEEYYIAL